jgi:hypothetical protein
MLQLVWTAILLFSFPCIADMTGVTHQAQSLFEMGSWEILPELVSNHNPPNVSLPSTEECATKPGLKCVLFLYTNVSFFF